MELGNQYRQGVCRAGFADEFKQPTAQTVVAFAVEAGDQRLKMLRSQRAQQLEAVFLLLRVMAAHQPHGVLELVRHVVSGRPAQVKRHHRVIIDGL